MEDAIIATFDGRGWQRRQGRARDAEGSGHFRYCEAVPPRWNAARMPARAGEGRWRAKIGFHEYSPSSIARAGSGS
jgi:hypothetical protein